MIILLFIVQILCDLGTTSYGLNTEASITYNKTSDRTAFYFENFEGNKAYTNN